MQFFCLKLYLESNLILTQILKTGNCYNMKKPIILLLVFFFSQISFSQTEKHIKIPGTKCSMIPPEGFVAATNFSGFQDEITGASIMINEIPGPVQSIIDGFTEEALKTKGMSFVKKQKVDLNKAEAVLISVTQSAHGIKYLKEILIFGNTNETILVNGTYPENSKVIEPKIKEALLSVTYADGLPNGNSSEAANFEIDIKETDFKLVKFVSGNLVYSTDGKIPTEKPTLIVGNSIANIPRENQRQYAEGRIRKLPRGELNVIKEIKEVSIDSLNGYEIVAHGKSKSGSPELIYLVLLFNKEGHYYIINGRANEDFDKNLIMYKKIATTFKRK